VGNGHGVSARASSTGATQVSDAAGATEAASATGAAQAAGVTAARGSESPDTTNAHTPAAGPASHNLSPAVRRLLSEHGLDASQVRGRGQGGRITVADVLAHGAASAPGQHAPANATADARSGSVGRAGSNEAVPGTAPEATPNNGAAAAQTRARSGDVPAAAQAPADVAGGSHKVPHTTTRKRIAEHMVQSLLHTAPHVTTVFEADLATVLDHRQQHKEDFARRGAPLTLTAYFMRATVAAIRAVPEANSRWTDSALEVFDSMHIGVATALETGLVVPVLRDVQSLDLFGIAKGLDDLVTRAREGDLAPADVRGGTFTISNHGVSGSLVATPIIINQPQSAILGVGKLEKRPMVMTADDGEDRIVIRPRCYVTLTIDHRVMDGHQANRFLQTFVERLVKPE
jgi:2-oxoglutarate dehydrogenase E2 component (dihydrolipoamide succinyltransferase)